MNLTITDLGERLQMLRKAMELSQKELAATLEVQQNQISRLENGIGGTLEMFLQLINYYGEHFHLHSMFSEEFEVIKKSENLSQPLVYNSIAVERLKLLKTEFSDQITDIISIIEKEGSF
jgi:transcriptional regulator with XRE-family HTH domain